MMFDGTDWTHGRGTSDARVSWGCSGCASTPVFPG